MRFWRRFDDDTIEIDVEGFIGGSEVDNLGSFKSELSENGERDWNRDA